MILVRLTLLKYSDQEVTSDISGNAVVHGDSSANVAGNQNNCYEAGSCITGDNGGVIQTLTAGSGNIVSGGTNSWWSLCHS